MASKVIPKDIAILLTRINFICDIKKGEKPNIRNMSISKDGNYLDAMSRWWYGENRDDGNNYIDNTIETIIASISQYEGRDDILEVLFIGLIKIRKTLKDRMDTYRDSSKIIAEIGTMLFKIDVQIKENNEMIKRLRKNIEFEIRNKDREYGLNNGLHNNLYN